ncbi:MAG TPA: hypothetical protein VFJ16_28105 [Longimicrobium sp.]|nr:hypothetical protein [Longimicrobium sp.]
MSEIPRPATLGPGTLADAVVAVRDRVGPQWETVATWETGVRELWLRLAEGTWEGLALRQRAGRLARAATRLVEGTSSALFRAARMQRLPWELGDEPLRALGREVEAFSKAAREVLELAAGQAAAAARLAALESRWAAGFPGAWRRWTGLLGLDPAEVHAGDSAEDLRSLHQRMDRLDEEMARWRGEVEAWLAAAGEADDGAALGVSEDRYLALLSIGAADRKSALGRTAELVRRGSREHLAALPAPGASPWATLVRDLAREWAQLPPGERLSAEETACYRVALAEAHARADEPALAGRPPTVAVGELPAGRPAAGGTTLYATPLDPERTGRPWIVVRPSPRTPLRVTAYGADPLRGELQVVLPDSEPALSPAELAEVLRFFEVSESRVPPYWWASPLPARFHLRPVRAGDGPAGEPPRGATFVGELVEKGRLVQLGEAAGARPRVHGDPPLFRAWREAGAEADAIYLERDPRVQPAVAVFQSPDTEGWVAEVPEHGPGRLWLRTAAAGARAPLPAGAFDAETELLHHFARVVPGAAVRVAHRGTVGLAEHGGRAAYLATTTPLGFGLDRCFRAAGPGRAADWGVDLAAGLLQTLAAAHAAELCVGVLSPPLVRARPAFHALPPVLRATIAAAPLAGRAGEPVGDELRRAPSWSGSPAAGSERSPRNDLVSLGRLLGESVSLFLAGDDPLRKVARELAKGAHGTADEALARLETAAPERMAYLHGVLHGRERPRAAVPA